jgi:hypothetical protein
MNMTSSMSKDERINELEALLQQAVEERNEAWCQLEENDIKIRPVITE